MTNLSKKRSPLWRFLDKHFIQNGYLPTQRLLYVLLTGLPFILIGALFNRPFLFFLLYNVTLLLFVLVDALLLPKQEQLKLVRHVPDKVDVQKPFEVNIEMINLSPVPLFYILKDDLPQTFEAAAAEIVGIAPAQATKSVSYTTKARERGVFTFYSILLRYRSWLGLINRQLTFSYKQEIHIYPNMSAVRGYLASGHEQLILEGKRINKKLKRGSEFDFIREYTPDDDPRAINWSATARQQRLMSNTWQPERGKKVTILLDCGRVMGIELHNQVKLDRTLEAALTLAAVALRQGDEVSLLAFSNDIKVYVPFGKGTSQLQKITAATFNLHSDFVESNYVRALSWLRQQQKKRSFIVIFSDMENYLLEDMLIPSLKSLKRQQPLLLLSLQDPVLQQWVGAPVQHVLQAFQKSIACQFSAKREAFTQRMAHMGIPVIDVPADRLALEALNAYLVLKSKEAL